MARKRKLCKGRKRKGKRKAAKAQATAAEVDVVEHLLHDIAYKDQRIARLEASTDKLRKASRYKLRRNSKFGYLNESLQYVVPSTSVVSAMSLEEKKSVAHAVHVAVTKATKITLGLSDEVLAECLGEWSAARPAAGAAPAAAKDDSATEWDDLLAFIHVLDSKSISDEDCAAVTLALGMSGMSNDVKNVRGALNAVIEARISITTDEYGTHCDVEDVIRLMVKLHGGTPGDYDVNINGDGRDIGGRTTTLIAVRVVLQAGHRATAVSSLWPICILNGAETYDFLNVATAAARADLQRLQKDGLFVDFPGTPMSSRPNCTIVLWLSADMKFLNLTTGMCKSNQAQPCLYCHASTKNPTELDTCCTQGTRHDPTVAWSMCRKAGESFGRGRKQKNLFHFIPTERVIVDLLHMFLRISDRLISIACDLALLHEFDSSDPSAEEDDAEAGWLTETFGRAFGGIAHCTVRIKQDEKSKTWTTSRLNGNKRKLIVRDFKLSTVFKKNTTVGAQLQATWDGFWTLYSLLNQEHPVLSIINAWRMSHDEEEVKEGDKTTAELRQEASEDWRCLAQEWLLQTVFPTPHPTKRRCKLQPATPKTFITPYVHIFVFHVHYFLISVGSLNDFTCQNLELANNLQGKQVFRQNCRRQDEEAKSIIMATLRNLLNIPAAVNSKSYRRRYFCPFCPGHAGSTSLGYLRRHVRSEQCPKAEGSLTPVIVEKVVEDSWERHFAALARGSSHVIVDVQAAALVHFEDKQPQIRKEVREKRTLRRADSATRLRYAKDKARDERIAKSLRAPRREQTSRALGLAKLVHGAEEREEAVIMARKYGEFMTCTTEPEEKQHCG